MIWGAESGSDDCAQCNTDAADSHDRNRVAEYLDTVREIERRIQLSEKQNRNSEAAIPGTPNGIPDDHEQHTPESGHGGQPSAASAGDSGF